MAQLCCVCNVACAFVTDYAHYGHRFYFQISSKISSINHITQIAASCVVSTPINYNRSLLSRNSKLHFKRIRDVSTYITVRKSMLLALLL